MSSSHRPAMSATNHTARQLEGRRTLSIKSGHTFSFLRICIGISAACPADPSADFLLRREYLDSLLAKSTLYNVSRRGISAVHENRVAAGTYAVCMVSSIRDGLGTTTHAVNKG